MKSKPGLATLTACLIALLAMGASAYLRETAAASAYLREPVVVADDDFDLERELEHPFDLKQVKGAPFSAQVVFERTQTLANGVQIARKMTGAICRDSEGRTRQELLHEGGPEFVVIDDRIAGVLYHLNIAHRTASEMSQISHRKIEELHQMREHEERKIKEEELQKREESEKRAVAIKTSAKHLEPERRVESLGTQNFESVQAEVTRVTTTIPAGYEGNDRPFEIVSEKWYSPDLQLVVMARRSDPRSGDMVYRLTNLTRAEPARSSFDVPEGFKVIVEKEGLERKKKHQ